MIDFPANPTTGQTFVNGGQQWTFDGTKWLPAGGAAAYWPPPMNDNRITNGDMRIDQRGVASSGGGSALNIYTVDRWQYFGTVANKLTYQQVGTPSNSPTYQAGLPYNLQFTSNGAYTIIAGDSIGLWQPIEADFVSDFAWGTSGAKSVTLSFWAMSSLTGLFSGAIQSYASPYRSYPFTFSLPTANAWTKITITIPGDTAGTWIMWGSTGATGVIFDFGCGANNRAPAGAWTSGAFNGATGAVSIAAINNATFNITGVKLEIGSVATPFNRQSLAKSLIDCQRYYQTSYDAGVKPGVASSNGMIEFLCFTGGYALGQVIYPVKMRSGPTITFYSPNSGASGMLYDSNANADVAATLNGPGQSGFSGWASGNATAGHQYEFHWAANAEL